MSNVKYDILYYFKKYVLFICCLLEPDHQQHNIYCTVDDDILNLSSSLFTLWHFRPKGYCHCLHLSVCLSIHPSVLPSVIFTLSTQWLITDLSWNHQICTKHASWDTLRRYWKLGSLTLSFEKRCSMSLLYTDLGQIRDVTCPNVLVLNMKKTGWVLMSYGIFFKMLSSGESCVC